MKQIKIIDESGDKKYFSQLPHYILNHSTANDQALYWQMKRYSGENGFCFATQETLMKKLGIGKKAYDKSLKYLLSKKWVKFTGMTKGKTRPIKTYSITDIWRLNILHYEKIPSESTLSSNEEISAESKGDKFQKQHKISSESNVEEEHTNKNNYKEEKLCLLLKNWNSTQTSPLQAFVPKNIVNKYGVEKIERLHKKYGEQNNGFGQFLSSLKEIKI